MNILGLKSTFRATGQTGIMIAGVGVPIDTVVVDFISGAAELVSPDNEQDHWVRFLKLFLHALAKALRDTFCCLKTSCSMAAIEFAKSATPTA